MSYGGGPLVLGEIDTGASGLSVSTTNGPISQSAGGITASGPVTLAATANNGAVPADVNLNGTENNFSNTVNASGANVTLADSYGGISLGNVTATGTTNVASAGGVSQAAGTTLDLAGPANISGGAGAVTLTNTGNQFDSALSLGGSNVTVQNVPGNLTLGVVSTPGALTLGASGNVDLGNATAGALSATSTGGNITQAGPLNVSGNSTVAAPTGTIALNDPGNVLDGSIALSGVGASVVDSTPLTLGNVALGSGGLTATAGGDITQASGSAITATGPTTLTASGDLAAINLSSPTNNFGGPVSAGGTGAGGAVNGPITINDANDLVLGDMKTTSNIALASTTGD
ncbi:MAG: beta strand repeat-containing protein, partial [Burkholderiales bacterium]